MFGILEGNGPLGLPDLEELDILATRSLNKGSSVGTPNAGPGSPKHQEGANFILGAGALTGGAVLAATAPEVGAGATGAGAGAGASTAKETAKSAVAKAATSGLTKDVLSAGLAVGIGELIKAYGLRLFEILAGGALILYGLITLARGGNAPNLPKVVPV